MSMRQFSQLESSFVIMYCLLFFIPLAAVCYYPNGYSESDLSYQPCVSYSGATSMCCGTNRTNPSGGSRDNGFTADICLENGLCENVWQTTDSNGTTVENIAYFRDQCTSTDWTNGGCLNMCTKETNPNVGTSDGLIQVTPCDGTKNSSTWCCGNNTSCCDTSNAITIAQKLGVSTTATTSTTSATSHPTSATSTPSSSTSSSPSPSPSPSSSSSSGLSGGAKAGIGVGVAVAAIALIALVFFFFRRRGRSNTEKTVETDSTPAPAYSQVKAQQELNQVAVHEKAAGPGDQRYELPGE